MPEFYMILARKIVKIPEFYMIFVRKKPEFYIIIARKIFFPNFRGHVPPCPPRLLRLCYKTEKRTPVYCRKLAVMAMTELTLAD